VKDEEMLYEDDVVLATCTHLEAHGWTIVSRCLGRTRGDYIVAQRGEARLLVECKGETSQDPRTRKYGQSFSPNQAYDHVSKAVLRCLRVTSRSDGLAAVAVPENAMHLKIISEVWPALARAGVGVFWVAADRSVRAELPWEAGTSTP
jgi:hypothetical protein